MVRQRGETWGLQETTDFLRFFGEVQKRLLSTCRNQAIYEELAARMHSHGYNRTPQQLRIKAKDLKRQYRLIKEKGQPKEGDAMWRFYPLLNSILCNDQSTQPATITSSAPTANGEEHREDTNGTPPPDGKLSYNQTPDYKPPARHPRASTRLSNPPLDASSTTRPLPQRQMRRPPAAIEFGRVTARTKKRPSMRAFTKAFLQEYSKNMKNFQQLFQVQLDTQRQQREEMERRALRSKKEMKAAASQMREAILIHAEAVNRVGDAIQTYNTLLQRCLSERGPQIEAGGNEA